MNPKRMSMEAEASGTIQNLSDQTLETAIEQLKTLPPCNLTMCCIDVDVRQAGGFAKFDKR